MSVDGEGKLTARPERYTINTHDKPNRVSTMVPWFAETRNSS